MLVTLLVVPAAIVAVAAVPFRTGTLCRLAAALMWAQAVLAAGLCGPALRGARPMAGYGFRLDAVAAVFLMVTTLVVAASLTHAVGYFRREVEEREAPRPRDIRLFYLFTALFLAAMYAVVAADNLGLLWISVEATTLLSAPLVYHYRSRTSLEATWKYLIICSVGITFAFLGTALFYAAWQRAGAPAGGGLSVLALTAQARHLPPGMLRLGFVFTLLGYGTKAGLFPLHSWLPDAHSEAPAPASAMLSGALLNVALVALWRTSGLLGAAGQGAFVRATLLPLGVLTVLAASLFLLRQRDLKRALAYSSMENVGLMAAAIALNCGGGFALQAINHSLVKVALFLLAGNLLQRYGTKRVDELRGVLTAQPAQGLLLLLAAIAIAGTPPFGSFLAEWQILTAAADGRHYATVIVLCAALAIAFIALAIVAARVAFGEPKASGTGERHASGLSLSAVPAALLAASFALGVLVPPAALLLAGGLAR